MKESQHIEYKKSWRDEYLKWICGFANADGGVLVIGRNDKGVVGVPNAARLMEDIANAFFRVAFMESWGRGIDLIRNVCRAAGKPEPAFRWDNGLWVEFALQEARTPVETLVETPGKTQGKTPARILELLQKNPNLTVPDIALQISKSESAVQRGILKLQIAGRLKRAGSRKSGYWEVLK